MLVYQTVTGDQMSWKVLPLEKKISLEFSDERNLSDEVLHIPAILIKLDPLSC